MTSEEWLKRFIEGLQDTKRNLLLPSDEFQVCSGVPGNWLPLSEVLSEFLVLEEDVYITVNLVTGVLTIRYEDQQELSFAPGDWACYQM